MKICPTYSGNGQGVATQAVPMTTLQGAVVSVDEFALTIRAANGEQVVVQNRPWSFALEQKFAAKVGEQIKLTGFYQNGLFEVAQMENLTNGARAEIRDQSGRPGWAGKGNGFNTGTVN
ncbi:MAG: hypothetical protein HZC40_08300 [Chloroflexi bacterium]|nr:hypothetical protein [Chloroflexota bacterium]